MPIRALSALVALLLTGCAVARTPDLARIALLAPFEGADRALGYEALYAARLAVREAADTRLELLPIDTGHNQAAERARALARDPLVQAVLLVGVTADAEIAAAFGDLPVVIFPNADDETGAPFIAAPPADPPDPDFVARFQHGDPFAPDAGVLAVRVYAAAARAVSAVQGAPSGDGSRAAVLAALSACCE